jgi:hypothetical protein
MEQDNHQPYYGGRQLAGNPSMTSFVNPSSPLRSGTSTPITGRNPFGDEKMSDYAASPRLGAASNPFSSPTISRPASSVGSSSGLGRGLDERGQRYFHSRRVKKGEVEKPWMGKKDPKEKWVTILPLLGILLGLAIAGFLVWDGLNSVVKHKYCLVLQEDWSEGFNTKVWTKEVQVGGFG